MDSVAEWSFKSMAMELDENFYVDYSAEEMSQFQRHSQLVAALKQKEEEVILAAQLGNALLLENRELKEQQEQLHEHFTDKLEELEQDKHALRVKLEGCQSQWESQVGDLERDVRALSAQVDQLTQALSQAERDQSRAELEHSEHTQQLREQLNTAMEVERAMSSELQSLKVELQQKGSHNRLQDEELISALKEQVLRLSQREQVLEQRLESVSQENTELRTNLTSLQTRLSLQDQVKQQHNQQLAEALQAAEVSQARSQQLQSLVEELQEELSLRDSKTPGNISLLSEMEESLDATGVSKKEISQKMGSILQSLLPLTHDPDGQAKSQVTGEEEELRSMLQQLEEATRTLTRTSSPHQLNRAFVGRTADQCGNPSAEQELRDQNARLRQENAQMKETLRNYLEQTEVTHQAIRDRDEAIAKKNLMETELVRCKNDMMSLNNQLLDAIQRKLELSQELEAWQDDIQVIINQQLRSQQQSEVTQKKATPSSISFFRRPSKTVSTKTRQSISSSPWSTDALQEKSQSPWKDWLRRGKV
ncbi:BICD family-like cargo adapter 1 isoform X1 [Synchiropus splendidus]|uniref:BICD family-like cargo adapter 1 isoform X1 n=1 Tax=Synchiropus splendidus TaxID=270530 RepID=UPI00237DA0CB|nr:BICD family-like cargo adapter 1 isoform X1 [Synchiropus splendidus]